MEYMIIFCRPGFEAEAGQELTDRAAALGMFGYFQPAGNHGYLRFFLTGAETAQALVSRLSMEELVFTRDWMVGLAEIQLPAADRVGAIVLGLSQLRAGRGAVAGEQCGPGSGKFCKKVGIAVVQGAQGCRNAQARRLSQRTGQAGGSAAGFRAGACGDQHDK